jgi:oligo-1,6-glucosidase
VYQGQELGMKNYPKEINPEDYMEDVETVNYWAKMQKMYPNDPKMTEYAKEVIHTKSRDHARTPIPWTSEKPNAGYAGVSVKPWMKLVPDFETVNAQAQVNHDDSGDLSVFQFWKRGLANREEHKNVFVYGQLNLLGEPLSEDDPIFAYIKSDGSENWVIVLNFSEDERSWKIPGSLDVSQWVAGNYQKGKPEKVVSGEVSLRPWEGILGQCK